MVTRASIVLAALAAALVLPASACWACSCLAGEPEQYWEWADVVFDGNPTDRSGPDAGGMITWTFEVVDVWKGEAAATQTLQSHEHGATCGMTFELGVTYRVYANGTGAEMSANLCSGTAPRDTFPAGPPATPEGASPSPTPTSTSVPTDSGTAVPTGGETLPPSEPGPTVTDPGPTDATPIGVGTIDPGTDVTVPADGNRTGVAIAAGVGGLGLLGLAAWLVVRGRG